MKIFLPAHRLARERLPNLDMRAIRHARLHRLQAAVKRISQDHALDHFERTRELDQFADGPVPRAETAEVDPGDFQISTPGAAAELFADLHDEPVPDRGVFEEVRVNGRAFSGGGVNDGLGVARAGMLVAGVPVRTVEVHPDRLAVVGLPV